MSVKSDSGFSLKDDIASIQTDPAFHDVTLVCSDGVEVGACRAILASRSPFFKAMFYGNMREATSNKVTLHDITSAALRVVLQFIYTEDIDLAAILVTIDVYNAANFLLLPKLMELVLERAHNIEDFGAAASLLNDAVLSTPWSENTKDLYNILLKPFCTHLLAVGDLNGLSESALELLLSKSAEMTEFNTPEYDLLLCIVEWAWTLNSTAESTAKRRAIFDAINLMPAKPNAKILLKDSPSHEPLLNMIQHMDLSLICPHRLKSITEAVDVLTETSPQYLAFCHYACKNTECPTNHPSKLRGHQGHPSELLGMPAMRFQWDKSKRTSGLVLSEKNTVASFPRAPRYTTALVRASNPCTAAPNGLCEWDIIVESTAPWNNSSLVTLGLVSESFDGKWVTSEWGFQSSNISTIYGKGSASHVNYGRIIQKGDVVTFHLNMNNRTCEISINGHNYGTAWTNLPGDVNLYPAATLGPNAIYRIKPHRS